MKRLKRYRVTYNVFYVSISDSLDLTIHELESKATVTFNIEAPNQREARQVASDSASFFLGEDFVIRGRTINSFKPLNIEEIK